MTLIGIGLWFRIDPKMYEPTLYIDTDNFMNVGWIMMFGGLAIVIISIVGCCGVLTNSTCKLGTVKWQVNVQYKSLIIVCSTALSVCHCFGLVDSLGHSRHSSCCNSRFRRPGNLSDSISFHLTNRDPFVSAWVVRHPADTYSYSAETLFRTISWNPRLHPG